MYVEGCGVVGQKIISRRVTKPANGVGFVRVGQWDIFWAGS